MPICSKNVVLDFPEKWGDIEICYLVLETEDFIVFIDKSYDVDWKTTDEYDQKGHENLDKHNSVLNRAASIECVPNEHQNDGIRINFKRMLAEGVARSLKHDYENAENILDEADKYIQNRNIEIARYWHLTSTCIVGACSVIFGILLWCFRHYLIPALGNIPFFIILSSVSGSIGATLSIIFRIGNSTITSEAEQKLHILESISRNFGGAISGLLVSTFICLGVVVPIFKTVGMSNLAMVAAGIIAGASERWAPSLIAQFEKSTPKIKR